MTNHSINLNTYYVRKSDYAENSDLVSDANGPDQTSHSGLMTPAQKTKLDGIATNANNYVHPNSFTAGSLGLYSIAINTNGHVTQIDDTHLDVSIDNTGNIELDDTINGYPLLQGHWYNDEYTLFNFDISQLLTDNASGKILSTNDYTTTDKTALTNLKTHGHGNITNAGSITTVIDAIDTTLDKLIVSDNSDSNKLKSVSFVDALDDVIQDLIQLGEQ